MKKVFFFAVLLFFLLSPLGSGFVAAEETPAPIVTTAPEPTPDTSALEGQIRQYEQKISDLKGQGKTLSSQIAIMDNQMKLTEAQIVNTKVKIKNIEKDIDIAKNKVVNLEKKIENTTRALLGRISATYQVGRAAPWQILLTSGSMSNFFSRLTYLRIVQAYDKKTIYAAEQAKNDYIGQQAIYEDKQSEAEALNKKLLSYTNQLAQDKKSKQALLSETQGSEANYQRLLAQARAQLAGFASFVNSQGGASLLSGQTSCDGWGCYYNQRDSQWGSVLMNGRNDCDGPCNLARVGCLVTSVSMVVSHLGNRNISPLDIVANSSNFWPGTAYLNKGTISANGVSITRTTIAGSLSPELVQNGPVIVGINYGPFGTHFVVVKSYTDGKYIMHDPFTAGGKDKVFTDHYSLGSVFSVDRVRL